MCNIFDGTYKFQLVSVSGKQIHCINKTLIKSKLINNENWCDIKQHDVKKFKLLMFYLMTCVNIF